MAAILVHERGRMHEIEAETGEIQEIRRDITVAQRNIITLATLGEGVISYLAIHREMKRSGNERKKRESLITELQKSNDTNATKGRNGKALSLNCKRAMIRTRS